MAARPEPAFDIVIDRTLTITQGGRQREMSVDEALQHKTYTDAIAGNRAARREVMKMIAKREQALAEPSFRTRRTSATTPNSENDPANAEHALLILGIARYDPRWPQDKKDGRLLLEPWTVQAALSRRGRKPLTDAEVRDVELCTGDAGSLVWPRGEKR